MKLKFRATPKDMAAFVAFSIVLLYFVAILVLNINSMATDGEIAGFNPFPAFVGENLPKTMVSFLLVLIIIIMGVSSNIFNREKGIGLSIKDKDEKGYSRWAKAKEIKKGKDICIIKPSDDHLEKGGIPLYNNGKELWIDTGGYHNMIIGSTGSGKSQSISFPYINVMAKAGESMIITDPKGELYEGTAVELKKRGYNIILLNFRDPDRGNCWNPFYIPYKLFKQGNQDKAIELLEDLAKNILYDEKSSNADPFWSNTSADYFTGLAYSLFQDAEVDEVNINSINYMATVGEEKISGGGRNNYIQEFFSYKPKTSTESIKVNSTISAPSETKGSILSVFNQKIQLFSSRDSLSEMLSHNDFDMEDIGRKKTAVFIVIQDEKKTYHSLVTIFLKQCYETLVRVAQENDNGKLKYRTNFLLDEFANMPPLSDVDAMVSAARSRNIRLSFIIQNFSQLNDVYGKEKAETIRGNCGNTIYLLSTELNALEEISKMCGDVKSKEKDKTDSRPLITVTDLQNFKEEEALILRSRTRPYRTKLLFDYKIEWGMTKEPAKYPQREKVKVKVFDLKKFVDDKRREKMNEMGGPNMFGLPNMFGGSNSNMQMPPMFNNMMNKPNNVDNNMPNLFENDKGMPNGFNVDDLIKKIDAKIAEIEEEEKKEAANKDIDLNKSENSNLNLNTMKENNNKNEEVKIPDVSDDQFFDDFFDDE